MKNGALELFIGESHRLIEICLWQKAAYQQLGECWTRLKSERSSFALRKKGNSERGESLRVEDDANVDYIEGKHDHTAKLITLHVADDWIQDFISLWSTVKPNDDKYSNHQYILDAKKAKGRGSSRKGYRIQVEYGTRPSGIEMPYELFGFNAK